MAEPVAFEVRGLAVGVAGRVLQREIDFSLAPRGRLAVAGPSGCGKTLLLRSLAWLDQPLEGTLRLDGQPPCASQAFRWRRQVVYVAQRASFFGGSVLDELARPFAYRAARTHFDPDAAQRALESLDLGERSGSRVEEMSEGERQRVALARAALLAPRVLLLDEPTSALDAATTALVERWLGRLDTASVLVSHDPAQRERWTSHLLTLEAPRA